MVLKLKLQTLSVEVDAPAGVELVPVTPELVRASERRVDGAPIGELELSTFKASLLIDREGVLEEKARLLAESVPNATVDSCDPVSLAGASGYRVQAYIRQRERAPLPYIHVHVVAPDDVRINGGLVVVARSQRLDWAAGDAIVASLKVGRRGAANE
jgi:hypothetical protein